MGAASGLAITAQRHMLLRPSCHTREVVVPTSETEGMAHQLSTFKKESIELSVRSRFLSLGQVSALPTYAMH